MLKQWLAYSAVYSLPIMGFISFNSTGVLTFLPVIEAFLFIPFIELLLKPNHKNHSKQTENKLLNSKVFDWIVYSLVPIQFIMLFIFLQSLSQFNISTIDIIGRIFSMGILCGVTGINLAHELGHRIKPYEQNMAKLLLLTSLYLHFIIEHNLGHHKHVATPLDPATSRKNETIYAFWLRSIYQGFISAWNIIKKQLRRKNEKIWSFKNNFLRFLIYQITFLFSIAMVFNLLTVLCFLCSALIGILLLETVNYIEHYGLTRLKLTEFRFENASPKHSWNSDHQLGRFTLFELSRHSDHHYEPQRKYQVLRHHESSPQLPTGYPGMMVLSLMPPIWFMVMNGKLDAICK